MRFADIMKCLNQCGVEINNSFSDLVYFIAALLNPSFKFCWLLDLKLLATTENRLNQNIIQLILDDVSKDTATVSNGLSD